MMDPERLFLEEYDIDTDYKPYETFLFDMFKNIRRADKELKRIDCVVEGKAKGRHGGASPLGRFSVPR